MKRIGSLNLALLTVLLVLGTLPAAGTEIDTASSAPESTLQVDPAEIEPFARLRYVEGTSAGTGSVTAHRADGYLEEVFFNAPLFRGDRLESDGAHRVELQLPDGTLVRQDLDTLLELVSLRDPAGRFGTSDLLALHRGSLQVDLPDAGPGGNALRVDTFACSIYPLERSAFRVDLRGTDSTRVRVEFGSVEVVGDRGAVTLAAGEMTSVAADSPPAHPRHYNIMVRDTFGRWVTQRDDVYALHAPPGEEYDTLPNEVRPYYGELSSYGRWTWVDDYGYSWVPRVESGWRPYYDGYWVNGPWGPTWVSYEPWGWATYRYGRWNFAVDLGWIWVPGRVWSTAWVSWHYGPSYVGWCPIGYWGRPVYVGLGFSWGHPWYDHHPWAFVHHRHFYYHPVDRVVVRRKHVGRHDLDRGIVSRRPIRTRRGAGTEDIARRVRSGGKGFEVVDPARESRETRTVRRSFRDEENALLSRRKGKTRPAVDPDKRVVRGNGSRGLPARGELRTERRATTRKTPVPDKPRTPDRETASRRTTGGKTSSGPARDVIRDRHSGRTAVPPVSGKNTARTSRPTHGRATERDAGTVPGKSSTTERSTSGYARSRPRAASPPPRPRAPEPTTRDRSQREEASSRERLRRLFKEANSGRIPSRAQTSRTPSRERAAPSPRSSPSRTGQVRPGSSRPSRPSAKPGRSTPSRSRPSTSSRSPSRGRSPARAAPSRSGSSSSGKSRSSGGKSSGKSKSKK